MFKEACKFDWPHVRTVAEEFRVGIGHLAPDLLEEMQGIADGVCAPDASEAVPSSEKRATKVDVLDIIALNARSEIALGQWDDGCTSLAWRIRAPGSERQVLGQNWDWRETVGKNLAMVSIEQEGKPKIWMVTEVRFCWSWRRGMRLLRRTLRRASGLGWRGRR